MPDGELENVGEGPVSVTLTKPKAERFAKKIKAEAETAAPKVRSTLDYGFVYHVFENKYYENKGGVWGPAGVDDIHRVLKVVYGIKDFDDQEAVIVSIRREAQIYQAARVAGCKAGVHKDKQGNPYLVLQSHKLVEPAQVDWSIVKEMIESMFGPEQSPCVYAWLQWAYDAYEIRTLAPWAVVRHGR